MSTATKIQWTDYTWSPWLGCRKVSPGCENCYITTTTPFRTRHIEHGSQREPLSEAYWEQPAAWNRKAEKAGTRPKVFPSLCDPFDNEVDPGWFDEFISCAMLNQHLDWLLLTKRPQNVLAKMDRYSAVMGLGQFTGFPDNIWLGVSVEDQKRADERIPILLSIPAKVRFLSVEPMLGPVDLTAIKLEVAPGFFGDCLRWAHRGRCHELEGIKYPTINWVIVGGESGGNARPCNIDWVRSITQQCKLANCPVFVKQLGSRPVFDIKDARGHYLGFQGLSLKHPKGGEISEWPEYLRVRQFPV